MKRIELQLTNKLERAYLADKVEGMSFGHNMKSVISEIASVISKYHSLTASTLDGKVVEAGDTVYVAGTCGVHATKVMPLEWVTNYEFFGKVPVSYSFSTKEAAEKSL